MTLWKQIIGGAILIAAGLVLSALYLPAAHPYLGRIGLLEPLTRIGLVRAAEGAEAKPSGPPGASGGPALVIAEVPQTLVMRDTVTSIGTARAARSVILTAEVPGRITAIHVASGDYVEAGALIAELDSEAAQIALDRATLMVGDAAATRDRYARLQSSGATTETLLQEAELALKTAELARRSAQFDLSQHRIVAPIAGWIGILTAEIGNQVTLADEITRIEDRSSVTVDFRVPERVVVRIAPGDPLTASPLALPGLTLDGRISALDNRVDEASRSLLVQAVVPNDEDRLRSGMAVSIALSFTGESHPAVDPLAIQWGSDGAFVWIVRADHALRQPVRILQRNSDVVLVDMPLQAGDLVVSEGVQALRPGGSVSLAPPDGARAAAPAIPKT